MGRWRSCVFQSSHGVGLGLGPCVFLVFFSAARVAAKLLENRASPKIKMAIAPLTPHCWRESHMISSTHKIRYKVS